MSWVKPNNTKQNKNKSKTLPWDTKQQQKPTMIFTEVQDEEKYSISNRRYIKWSRGLDRKLNIVKRDWLEKKKKKKYKVL